MISQVMRKVFVFVVVMFVLLNGFILYKSTTGYERYLIMQWAKAKVYLSFDQKHRQYFKLPTGAGYEVPSSRVITAGAVSNAVNSIEGKFLEITLCKLRDYACNIFCNAYLFGEARKNEYTIYDDPG